MISYGDGDDLPLLDVPSRTTSTVSLLADTLDPVDVTSSGDSGDAWFGCVHLIP